MQGSSSNSNGNDEDVALTAKGKMKSKKGPKGGAKRKGEWKRDMSRVKCFACQKFGHYAVQCSNKKKKKQVATSAEVDEYATQFK